MRPIYCIDKKEQLATKEWSQEAKADEVAIPA
jgi:hypothetical protein